MRFHIIFIILSILSFSLVACGPAEDENNDNNTTTNNTKPEDKTKEQGYTSCSDDPDVQVVCPPGQYCQDASRGDCDNGCQSNNNCTEGQTCVIESGENKGLCKDSNVQVDELARCREACGVVVACGVTDAGDPCNADCAGLTADQQKTFADCVLNWGSANSCPATLPGCLGRECGPSYACGAGQDCLDGTCL